MNGGEIGYKYTVDSKELIDFLKGTGASIEQLNKFLDQFGLKSDEAFGATKENIKIQKEVILELENQYKDLQKTIDKIAPGQAKLNLMGDAAGIAKEIEVEKKALIELETFVKSNQETHESLRQKLTAVKNEMQELAAAGKRDSLQYDELSNKADDYQKAIDEVNSTMKSLGGNAGLNALVQTLGLASGAMATFQGFAAMAAGDNERLDQIMVKLQSTMSIAIGVQQIQNSLQRESGIIQSVMALQAMARARAERLATTNTIAATVAQRVFNAVAKANPYVLLALALTTVVGALVLFSNKTKKAVEEQNAINKSTAEGAAESIIKYKQLQTQWNALADDFKGKQKFIEDNKDKFNELGVEVGNVNEAQKFLVDQSKNVVGALMLQAEAAAYAQIATEKYKEAILADKEIEQFDKDWKEAGFFGKVGLGAKAVFTNVDDKKGERLRKGADKDVETQLQKLTEGQAKMDKAAREYDDKIKNKTKQKAVKTAKEKADEYFPPGSVAEIQRRLSEIDKALSKATGEKQISDLKTKRIAAASELAEAEKKIQILSIQEQLDQSNRLWTEYYSTVESLGKNVADNIYGDLLKEGQSQFDQLSKLQMDLRDKSEKGILTAEEKEVFKEVNQAIDEMLGRKSAIDRFNSDIEDSLSKLSTASARLIFLQKEKEKLTTDDMGNGKNAVLEEFSRRELDEQKRIYQQFIQDQKTFEEKRNEIAENASATRIKILDDESLTPERKADLTSQVTKEQNNATSAAALDELQNSDVWQVLNENLDSLTAGNIERLLMILDEKAPELAAKMTPMDFEKVKRNLRQARQQLLTLNPFTGMISLARTNLEDLSGELGETDSKFNKWDNAKDKITNVTGKIKLATKALEPFQDILGETGNEVLSTITMIATGATVMVEQIDVVVKATADGIKKAEMGSVILAILQIVMMAVKMIISLFNMFSGDAKKEQMIKQWADQVANLKDQYEALAKAIEGSAQEGTVEAQRILIANLREQQALLKQMKMEEADKKKADEGKIDDYNQQIKDNNEKIEDLIREFQDSVITTDIKTFSEDIANALIEAFGAGEDAAAAFDKVVDDVMRNAVANALRIKILQPVVEEMVDKLYSSMGFGNSGSSATQAQINELERQSAEVESQILQTEASTLNPKWRELVDKSSLLKKQIDALRAQFGNQTLGGNFDGLTDEEREEIKNMGQGAMQDYMAALQQYSDLFGTADADAESLKGAVKGVTEDTAGLIAGQMNAIRMAQAESLIINRDSSTILRNSLIQLTQIEVNTRRLHNIDRSLQEMNSKMKSGLAGMI